VSGLPLAISKKFKIRSAEGGQVLARLWRVGHWMFDVFFITKEQKNETSKTCAKHFVLFRFRVFVIHFFDRQPPTTDY